MFKHIKNIFFDFDGVILDSVSCKTNAFEKMYQKYGNKISKKVVEYHIENGGISRFEKFRYWHKKYLNKNLSKSELKELTDNFSKLVFNEVVNSNEIEGSIDFISKNHMNYKFWIITGTPTNEIKLILEKLKISQFFIGVYGSPESKTFWTEHIINKHKLDRNQTLFIGDAKTDYEAANFSSLNFALRLADYNISYFEKLNVYKFKNFLTIDL
jgi:HAD superfamily hydrolase (TIGR01549 family)